MTTLFSKSLQVLNRQLKQLAGKIEKVAEAVEKAEQAASLTPKKPSSQSKAASRKPAAQKAKAAKTAAVSKKPADTKPSSQVVLDVISNAPEAGIDTASLSKKTGLRGKKLSNIVYRLKKQGKIVSPRRGVYKAA